MCGRFALSQPKLSRVERVLNVTFDEISPRFNIAPSEHIPVIRWSEGSYEMSNMKWGLVPSWSKAPITAYSTFNARIETVSEKPMFRTALQQRRCLIPASGFYEWRTENDRRQPYYFTMADGEEMVLAGLWEEWRGSNGETLQSCAVLVGQPNALVNEIHGRMAVIVPERLFGSWLNHGENPDYLLAMLSAPYPAEKMHMWKVGRQVNSVRNQGADLILPLH